MRIGNSEHYKLVYRIVRLMLILPVSTTTTTERFSAMKIVKTDIRNKMENDFLTVLRSKISQKSPFHEK